MKRETATTLICAMILVALFTWISAKMLESNAPAIIGTRVLTVEANLCTATQFAAATGYEGNLAAFACDTMRANHWQTWPILYAGDRVLVPIYAK